jgi:glutamate dehydrogenase/leucine dehydrogenase
LPFSNLSKNLVVEVFLMIPSDPLLLVHIQDSAIGLEGFVALYNLAETGACGGIRCVPDITAEEVKALARAMTYKYAFFNQPQGGGKGGMVMDYHTPPARRRELARCMGQHLKPLLRTGLFHPWTDMNFGAGDAAALYEGAGLSSAALKGESSRRTALSTLASVIATAEALGLPPQRCRIAIEGLGSVGGILAQEVVRWGGQVVAVSNMAGAVVNEDGLPVERILQLRQQHNSSALLEPGPWRNVPREELFNGEADILVPCARVGSLNEERARRLPVRAVVPAANVPWTPEAERILQDRQILLLPDFVVNAGGILGIFDQEPDEYRFFMTHFKGMIDRLVKQAWEQGMSPVTIARRLADQNFDRQQESFFRPRPLSERVGGMLRRRKLLPSNQHRKKERHKQQLQEVIASAFC